MKGFLCAAFGPSQSIGDHNHWMFAKELGYKINKKLGKYGAFNEKEAFKLGAVFGSQRNTSESLAILSRYFVKEDGDKRERVEHPSLRIFKRNANPLMTSYSFIETLQNHAMGWGNGYAELQMERGGTRVINAWPIPPDRCRPVPFENSKGELDIVYEILLPDGSTKFIKKELMLHIKGISFDGISGQSIISCACRAIGLGDELENFATKFYEQGIIGGGFIEVPAGMQKDAIKNLREDLAEWNEGIDNAHRFKYLYDSVKYSASGIKPEEAQFVATRTALAGTIAMFYRQPLHKLGLMEKINYNSAELLNTEFVTDTLMPWGTRWEQEVDMKFFTEPADKDIHMKFNYNVLLRGDSKSRAEYYRTLVMSGIMTRNEARKLEDFSPLNGGDELLQPLNMIEAGSEKKDAAQERVQD